ncbi:kinetochore-associated protein NSL1 homolog [Eleutherodactylus coqui]|uniref:kinetochore-associated protein NSL1 homolog n=1 Tax=Eleutherodactylus coqui TaxID=57060 RepID=UPI003462F977
MAANVDSPKRRSVQLQRGSPEEAEGRPRGCPAAHDNRGGTERREDGRAAPSTVGRLGGDVGETGSPQESRQRGDDCVGRIDVQASSTTSRTTGGERVGPSVEMTAGSSGVPSSENAGPSAQSTSPNSEKRNPSLLSPSRRLPCGPDSPVRNADRRTSGPPRPRDGKVQCVSKKLLQDVLGMCADFSRQILESQSDLNQEQRQRETHNFIWNFETALQDNISVNGQPWHEAPDTPSEPAFKLLEDRLDDSVLETMMKRKRNPRKILHHFVKGLKVEREILDHYKPEVRPEEAKLDSRSESRMTEQSAAAAAICQQIKETMKALPAHLEKAEGFSQVLSLQPLLQGSHLRQDIFSNQVAPQPPAELETTPGTSVPAATLSPGRSLRRRPSSSLHNDLYPLRSKRKISLEG